MVDPSPPTPVHGFEFRDGDLHAIPPQDSRLTELAALWRDSARRCATVGGSAPQDVVIDTRRGTVTFVARDADVSALLGPPSMPASVLRHELHLHLDIVRRAT